jgi:diguanylate cyclase (GGDEF)-like protein
MPTVISPAQTYNPWLVALSIIVCSLGIRIATRLVINAISRGGRQRRGWMLLAAIAGGASIWCTHCVAILAFNVPAGIAFDPILTLLSLIVAIVGSAIGFQALLGFRRVPEIGGGFVGLSIVATHYIGIITYNARGNLRWEPSLVVASIALALVLSVAATSVLVRLRGYRCSDTASFVMFAAAVLGLQFTAMTAMTVVPTKAAEALNPMMLGTMAVAIVGVAMMVAGTAIASLLIDEDASRESVEKMKQLALNDGLTGLPNRAAYSDYLGHELHRAEIDGFNVAVVAIDLDRFKEINDLCGHAAGDQVLKIIGYRLGHLCRDGEFVARISGDEFAAIKRFSRQNDVMEFLARIEAEIGETIKIKDFDGKIGASLGIGVYPQDGEEVQRLVNNAELAMQRAKKDISRTTCFYESEMDEAARERASLANDLRKAIELGQLELHYQVQHHIPSGTITGYEVLLRWKHPVRGFVPPDDFISIAEETGLIVDIGEWVLRTACAEAASWPDPIRVAVNVSPVQFMHANLEHLVHQVLLETGLKAGRLELEITESTIIEDRARALHLLRRIRALGVTIAIDDFGTGYSSFETLRTFPFDKIKLDRSFLVNAEVNLQSRAIIRAVLALGKSLNIAILAEGIETPEQLALLAAEGCDEAQGYLLGRPSPNIEISASGLVADSLAFREVRAIA